MNATDTQGWTAIHHLVAPLEFGTFDEVDMLNILVGAGADHDKKDNAGLTPLDHALIKGASKLAAELQNLAKVEKDKQVGYQKKVSISIVLSHGFRQKLHTCMQNLCISFCIACEA